MPKGTKTMSSAEALNLLSDGDGAVRKAAAKSLGKVLGENVRTFSLITNTLAKDKEIEDKWRGFERPVSARNLSGNYVEDEVVDALSQSVRAAYPDLSHRYYKLKAKWFGVRKLDYWDRNAPLPNEDNSVIRWDDAVDKVLDAYGRFSPKLVAVAQDFLTTTGSTRRCVRARSPGAFAHPTVPSAHPYLLLNYQGKTRDVMTLAHELGHGVHQVLAAKQGHLMSDTPLTLAETASVFGEMLTFRKLLAEADDPKLRKTMLAGKVEDMLNTVVRQIAFFEFERRVHEKRREGELLADEICDIWMDVQRKVLGRPFDSRKGVQILLDLHPPLHSLAILRLCLCLRRLSGELALCRLRERFGRLCRALPGHAARGWNPAPQGVAGAVWTGCVRSGILEQRAGCDFGTDRRTRGAGVLDGR